MQNLKTLAILITEKTYPIAVACLPAGFVDYPFANVKGFWLVINVPGSYEPGEFQREVGLHNEWIHPKKFVDKYTIVPVPGRKADNPWAWVEVERSVDEELKTVLEPEDEEDDVAFTGATVYRKERNRTTNRPIYRSRRHVVGYNHG